MTGVMIVYSSLFCRFAWAVQPRNYLLLACHAFNVTAQGNQMRRALEYKVEKDPNAMDEIKDLGTKAGGAAAAFGLLVASRNPLMATVEASSMAAGIKDQLLHPAGPFYIHFWAPTFKWALSVANLADLNRPVEKVSTSQQSAMLATGVIWSRYSMVINPVNYNLMAVNLALAATSGWHVARKLAAESGENK